MSAPRAAAQCHLEANPATSLPRPSEGTTFRGANSDSGAPILWRAGEATGMRERGPLLSSSWESSPVVNTFRFHHTRHWWRTSRCDVPRFQRAPRLPPLLAFNPQPSTPLTPPQSTSCLPKPPSTKSNSANQRRAWRLSLHCPFARPATHRWR